MTRVLSANSNRNNFSSEKKYSASFPEDARRNASKTSRGTQSTRYCCSALIKTGNSLQILVKLSNTKSMKKYPLTGLRVIIYRQMNKYSEFNQRI